MDSLITSYVKKDLFSGTILVAQKGNIIYLKAFGFADRERKILNQVDTSFMLSSASKVFTGTAIMKLVQENKLSVKDTINKFLANIPNGDKITIHNLLTHTSGLTDYYDHPNFSYDGIKTCTDVLPFIEEQKPSFAPGDSVCYSTAGMILLGAIIEKVTGESFQEYVKKSILDPLEMTHTSFKTLKDFDQEINEHAEHANGYLKSDSGASSYIMRLIKKFFKSSIPIEKVKPSDFVTLSAGGMRSSVTDLYKFDQALYSDKILDEKHKEMMFKKYVPVPIEWNDIWHFGYVWIVQDKKNKYAVGHPGTSRSYHSIFFRYINDKTTIIILTNYGFADVFMLWEKIESIVLA